MSRSYVPTLIPPQSLLYRGEGEGGSGFGASPSNTVCKAEKITPHIYIHKSTDNSARTICVTAFSDSGRKPVNPEETHSNT